MRERAGHGVNHRRVNQRFVALDVHHRVALATSGDFGDAIGSARVIRSRHFRVTKILCHFPDPCVVRRDDDFAQRPGFLALLDDVLNERLADDERKRFAGKPR